LEDDVAETVLQRVREPAFVHHLLRDMQVLVAETKERNAELLPAERNAVVQHERAAHLLDEGDLAVEVGHLGAEGPDPQRPPRSARSAGRVVRAIRSRSSSAERSPRWNDAAIRPCSSRTMRSATGATWSTLWSM